MPIIRRSGQHLVELHHHIVVLRFGVLDESQQHLHPERTVRIAGRLLFAIVVQQESRAPLELIENPMHCVAQLQIAAQHSGERCEAIQFAMLHLERGAHTARCQNGRVPGAAIASDRCQCVVLHGSEKGICFWGFMIGGFRYDFNRLLGFVDAEPG